MHFPIKKKPVAPRIILYKLLSSQIIQDLLDFHLTRRFMPVMCSQREPGSSVSIVSGYGLDDREIEV
jgi:hypothetical protein